MIWRCGSHSFDLSSRVLVMGVLNVTPDSFSDGGRYFDPEAATRRGLEMIEQGADLIDIGGESSRPGAAPVDPLEELRRTIPVIEALKKKSETALSIDTTKAPVARAAIEAGADVVNDITALRGDPDMIGVLASSDVGLVLMHMQGSPRTMQARPSYGDVVVEIRDFLAERIRWATEGGVDPERIAVDPGIGFGKTLDHNLEIFRRMDELKALGRPLLVGPSRKTFLRRLLADEAGAEPPPDSKPVEDGGAAAVAASVGKGASIIRVHDVEAMARVVKVAASLR